MIKVNIKVNKESYKKSKVLYVNYICKLVFITKENNKKGQTRRNPEKTGRNPGNIRKQDLGEGESGAGRNNVV